MGHSMMAKPVEPEKAMQVAKNFVAQYVKGTDKLEATVVYTHKMPKSGQPAMYVVNLGNMFVIVSADDIAHPVLGYSLSRPWSTSETQTSSSAKEQGKVVLPSQVTSYLNDLAAQIEAASGSPYIREASPSNPYNSSPNIGEVPEGQRGISSEWRQLLSLNSNLLTTTNLPDSVGPLITTTWDQGQYYNALCPEDAAGPAGHAVTGCVATAMAQIINYWGYPLHGRGIHSYETTYGTLTVNYDSATYDYAHMPDALTATSTPQEVNAVATLMRDCGVAANMGYGPNESSAYDIDARAGLINFFRFNPNLNYAEKAFFMDSIWENMLRSDIAANRPVMYSGQGDAGGHSFVCDGYKQNGYFHFNFGWSGYADGWYLTSAVNPAGMAFNSNQSALFGIVPDSAGNVILGQMAGASTFTVDNPLEFYHLLGHNAFTGTNYTNTCSNNVDFVSANDTVHLVVDIIHFDGQNLHIYAGNEVRHLNANNTNDLSPIVSSYSTVGVDYSGTLSYSGFKLCISQDNGCRMISNVGVTVDTTAVALSWSENGSATGWQIEYGTEGYPLGEGTTLMSSDSSITVSGLVELEKYDFYIRPQCGGAWFGPVKIMTKAHYWIDIVETQPDGYVASIEMDQYGRYPITVSSAEGLAWWAKQVRDSIVDFCTTVNLAADIDLGGYLWKPVYEYYGTFNGNGHTISNMTIIEEGENSENSGWGFFRMYRGFTGRERQTVSNLTFRNPYIRILNGAGTTTDNTGLTTYYFAGTGVIAGRAFCATIMNCGVNNGIITQSYSQPSIFSDGEVVGIMEETSIINCYATGNLMSVAPTVGGLIGTLMGSGTSIINSYTSVSVNAMTGLVGSICGSMSHGDIHNCYVADDDIPLVGYNSNINGSSSDTIRFNRETQLLNDNVYFDGVGYRNLLAALNKKVEFENDSNWKVWQADSSGLNNGFPLLGGNHVITCPNVSNMTVVNVEKDSGYAIRVAWDSDNQTTNWRVKYWEVDSLDNSALYMETDTNVIDITNIILGREYNIGVRRYCDETNHSGWGDIVQITFDKPYWTDIVTSQPEGYIEDTNGNVTITSAEGLAWLSCLINGLHNQDHKTYLDKTVNLVADIDLGRYKWMPMGSDYDYTFQGVFNGNNHVISNMYINENRDNVGLFGYVYQHTYSLDKKFYDITLDNGHINGGSSVGGFLGYYISYNTPEIAPVVLFDNCHSVNVFVEGNHYVGAILGQANNCGDKTFINCSSSGNVYGEESVGGLFGVLSNSANDTVINCYSSCNVYSVSENTGGLIGWAARCLAKNSYSVGSVVNSEGSKGRLIGFLCSDITCGYLYGLHDESQCPLMGDQNMYEMYTNTISDTSSFSITGVLNNTITIGGSSYLTLLSALNAWVDANGTNGVYRHWAADSANINGGFPVFARIPCTPATGSDSIIVCDSYIWHGITYTTDAILIDSLSTFEGCDSIVTHYLTVNHSNSTTETDTACEAYFWDGEWRYFSGQYIDTTTNTAGCDSIATLNLTINNPVHTATTVTACDSYTWQEAVITTSGTYHYTHTDAHGCTQDDTLYLTINYSTNSILTDTACGAYFWNGEWLYVSGQYADTNTNIVGCDSIVTLNLTINNPVNTATTVTACDSYTWHDAVITTSGTYHYTHTDANGCTQDDTLYLTINHNDTVIVDEEVCDSLTWYGTTYTASAYGVQYLIVPNTVGCDSIFFLDLTVNYTTYGEMSAVSCDGYEWDWNGAVYTASGDYTYRDTVNMNSQFCDSVLTLHLTINHSATADTTATACDLFVWYGHMGYDVSGNYEHRWWNVTADGCDSILTLHLTINHSAETTVTDTAEGIYTWNGTTYTESGTYTWTGETVEGCDSSVTLILTINQVGIFDIQNSEFKINIFPNPTTDLLTIDADDILSVELFDLNGRRIFSSEVDSSPFTVHLSPFTLSAGSYLLRIHTRQGTAVQHVILK